MKIQTSKVKTSLSKVTENLDELCLDDLVHVSTPSTQQTITKGNEVGDSEYFQNQLHLVAQLVSADCSKGLAVASIHCCCFVGRQR